MQIGDIDLSSPDSFAEGIPHEYFALLRKEAPVYWQEREHGEGFWCVTRYHDILEVEKNPQVFSSQTNISPDDRPDETLKATIDHMLILSDQPRHTFLRKMVMKAFTPKAIAKLNESIDDLAIETIDAVTESGECDMLDVAAYMPVEVVAEMLGVPKHDRKRLFDWANAIFGASDPDVSDDIGTNIATMEMFTYAQKLADKLRAKPEDNMFSVIANAEEDGEQLDGTDLGCFFMLMATAGNETTRTQILLGTMALLEHPEAAQALRKDPSLMANAIEEMLRWSTPLISFGRLVKEDYLLNGQQIKAGDKVFMWYCSGCRDEAVFEDPDRFDIHRKNANKHMAFGAAGSIHRCIGANLARTELIAMFNAILTRMPEMEMTGPVVRLRSNFTNGIKSLPVRFKSGTVEKFPDTQLYQERAKTASAAVEVIVPPTPDAINFENNDMQIKLIPLATAALQVGTPHFINNGPKGTRVVAEIASAKWEGARLNAQQLGAAAADWALIGADGSMAIDVRCTLQTDDGAIIYVYYNGRSKFTPDSSAALVISPVFETGDPKYLWLNSVQAIGRGTMDTATGILTYEIYEVQ